MTKKYFTLISVCILLLLSGCSDGSDSTNTPTNQNSVLVIYQRSGGFAGLRDELTVYSNGDCELQRKAIEREFTLEPDQLAHLKQLMEEESFLNLKGEFLPPNTGADFFEYVVSYQAGESKMHTVRTVSGAVPDALQPILSELDKLISDSSQTDNIKSEQLAC